MSDGIVYPEGFEVVFDRERVDTILLAAYGPEAQRVHCLGKIGEQWVAVLWVDPTYPWLAGHFKQKTVVRGCEFSEMVAQVGILMAFVTNAVAQVRLIGRSGGSERMASEDPKRQGSILPGDTVLVYIDKFRVIPPSDKGKRYFRMSGRGRLHVGDKKIAYASARGWIIGRPDSVAGGVDYGNPMRPQRKRRTQPTQ